MKRILETRDRLLRGPRASAFLRSLGIDPRRYWLLVDLFDELCDRGEMLDQLGRNGLALRAAAWIYAAFSALLSTFLIVAAPPLATYFTTFFTLTAFLLLVVLLSETGNSLVNPEEGLVLAHQPVNGATYTAAKLTHLVRITLYLVAAINGVPALAGLMLKESVWFYPLIHLLAALGAGFLAALLCCALYGWLIRLVPPRRLKAAGQLAGAIPLLAMVWWPPVRDFLARLDIPRWLPDGPEARWTLGLAIGAAAVAVVTLGIRSLSADYLIRVSGIMRGGRAGRPRARESWTGAVVARFFGGQPARAGFALVCRMTRRDFQFRRQALPMLIVTLPGLALLIARGWRADPFSGRLTTVHLLPHVFGFLMLFICSLLPYGTDFKGAWVYLLAPVQAFGAFARGVYAALSIQAIFIPHTVMLLLFLWPWGAWRAGLFVAYSVAVSLVYLALELRLIDAVPFSRQADAMRSAVTLPLMILAGLAVAAAVGLQYFLVFRSAATVGLVTVALTVAAYFLTRSSLNAVEGSIRYRLGLLAAESGTLYTEIEM